jgi:hypothetical protein
MSSKASYPKINHKERSVIVLNKDREEIKATVKKKNGGIIITFENLGGRNTRGVPYEKKLARVQSKSDKKRRNLP